MAAFDIGELADAGEALLWWEFPGDDGDRCLLAEGRCEVFANVTGGVNESTEDNRVETLLQEVLHCLYDGCELRVALWVGKGIGGFGEGKKASAIW